MEWSAYQNVFQIFTICPLSFFWTLFASDEGTVYDISVTRGNLLQAVIMFPCENYIRANYELYYARYKHLRFLSCLSWHFCCMTWVSIKTSNHTQRKYKHFRDVFYRLQWSLIQLNHQAIHAVLQYRSMQCNSMFPPIHERFVWHTESYIVRKQFLWMIQSILPQTMRNATERHTHVSQSAIPSKLKNAINSCFSGMGFNWSKRKREWEQKKRCDSFAWDSINQGIKMNQL